jgi:sterol desaturase/sphingolipid hydroxylase (fatty acid hydroxylase superfamily)
MILMQYGFWLAVVSVFCFLAERVFPWRKQNPFRHQFPQDFFWLIFNGFLLWEVFKPLLNWIFKSEGRIFTSLFGIFPDKVFLLDSIPFWLQVVIFLLIADFLEWCIHNLLHRVEWLWKFHRLHHSIHTMDWIGNFRFHWGEVLVYNSIKYLPLALLGANPKVILITAVVSTLIGHLNHSNLNISWGPLRFILNSPRMHIWHHEKFLRGKAGKNFAVVFSFWDWIFGTAYMPLHKQPEEIGFEGDERFSDSLIDRFFIPFLDKSIFGKS